MKYLLIIISMIPLTLIGQDLSQPFGGTNAKWVYNFTGMVEGVTVVEPSHDTLVGSRLLTIFEKATYFEEDNGEKGVWGRAPVYVHSDEGVVEFSTDLVNFDTLFNFQLEIGDSWTIIERNLDPGQLKGDTIYGNVVDTFSILRNDGLVFCQAVLWNESTSVDTVFQDFGSRYSYILPFENRKAYGEGNVLLCFENDRLGPIDFEKDHLVNCPSCGFTTFEYDCGMISSVLPNPISDSDINVFPNPASSSLFFLSENIPIENVKMYNLQGQLVLETKARSQDLQIDTKGLNVGMYVLIINDSYYEKIVVNKN